MGGGMNGGGVDGGSGGGRLVIAHTSLIWLKSKGGELTLRLMDRVII